MVRRLSPVPSYLSPGSASGPTSSPPAPAPLPRGSGHPFGLYVLSAAEACERFGFYLILALLALYLNEHHGFSTETAFRWYGSYLAWVYFSPLFGGWLGGRLILRRSWVIVGALLLALGYVILGIGTTASLLPALFVLTIGNGLFKPNISTLVGGLYPPGDGRRDEGFGIFYLSVNIGAMIAPVIGERLRGGFGWTAAFGTAATALVLAAVVLHLGRRSLPGQTPDPIPESKTSARQKSGNRRRVAALLVIGALVMPFWMGYFQTGSTLTFFARDNIDRTLPSWNYEIRPGDFASLGGFFVLVLTAPLAWVMRRMKRRGLHLTSADKIVCGLAGTGLAYALLCCVTALPASSTGKVNMMWLVGFYFVLTISELLLSPIGLSLVSKLAPTRWVGLLMGVWFLASAGGNKLAGQVGSLWTVWSHARFFGAFALLLVVTALVLATQLGWLRQTLPRENS